MRDGIIGNDIVSEFCTVTYEWTRAWEQRPRYTPLSQHSGSRGQVHRYEFKASPIHIVSHKPARTTSQSILLKNWARRKLKLGAYLLKFIHNGSREMAQWLRVHTALIMYLSWVPSTHVSSQLPIIPPPGRSGFLLWLQWTLVFTYQYKSHRYM